MRYAITGLLSFFLCWTTSAAFAQSNDAAAERARLANQRIAAEVELREKASNASEPPSEPAVNAEVAQTAPAAAPKPAAPPVISTVTTGDAAGPSMVNPSSDVAAVTAAAPTAGSKPAADIDVSRALEELQRLGELKDAGYVTEDEFERIKRRILDGRF